MKHLLQFLPLRGRNGNGAFSLAELMIATAAATIVLGALLTGAGALRRTVNVSERYSVAHASQTRLIDTVASDLRGAVGVATTNPATGISTKISAFDFVTIDQNRYLTLTLPGYYQSDDPSNSGYDQPQALISTGNAVRYGDASAVAQNVTVQYEKVFLASENSTCYIRRQGSDFRIVATGGEDLDLDITADSSGTSFLIEVWYVSEFSNQQAQVESSDNIMLRNRRYD